MNEATKNPQYKNDNTKKTGVYIVRALEQMRQVYTFNATPLLGFYIHNTQGGNPPNPAMKTDEIF